MESRYNSDRLNLKTMKSQHGYLDNSRYIETENWRIYYIYVNKLHTNREFCFIFTIDKSDNLYNMQFDFDTGSEVVSRSEYTKKLVFGYSILNIARSLNKDILKTKENLDSFNIFNLDSIEVIRVTGTYLFRLYINNICKYEFHYTPHIGADETLGRFNKNGGEITFNSDYRLDKNNIYMLNMENPKFSFRVSTKGHDIEFIFRESIFFKYKIHRKINYDWDLDSSELESNCTAFGFPDASSDIKLQDTDRLKTYKSNKEELIIIKEDDNKYHAISYNTADENLNIDGKIEVNREYGTILGYILNTYDIVIVTTIEHTSYKAAVIAYRNNQLRVYRYNLLSKVPFDPVEFSILKPLTEQEIKDRILKIAKENIK